MIAAPLAALDFPLKVLVWAAPRRKCAACAVRRRWVDRWGGSWSISGSGRCSSRASR